jgi:hypothetical protein
MGRCCCARDVVAEVEDRVEVVFEGESEDRVKSIHEIEWATARLARCVPYRAILRFFFMAAPQFPAAARSNRGAKITSGPAEGKNKWDGPARPPRTCENPILSLLSLCKVHECFHSPIKTKSFVKPAWMKELLRHAEFSDRGFAVVLVPKFLPAPTRFVGISTGGRPGQNRLHWLRKKSAPEGF